MTYEVQTLFVYETWESVDSVNGEPVRFNTRAEADADLKKHLLELKDAVALGHVTDYDPKAYRIRKIAS
jgi:hypothetical protein